MAKEQLVSPDHFLNIVLANDPLIDVRAPVEFAVGSLPGSVNLPLLSDDERCDVGICYKEKGQEAAIARGNKLVSGRVKEQRLADWLAYCEQHDHVKLFCSRGGMRSQIVQQWILENSGISVPRLEGGYKRFRAFLIEALLPENIPAIPVLLGGRTGCGKTILLHKLPHAVDLEGAAHHRGSAFGGYITPQPCQVDFENRLACQVLEHKSAGFSHMVVEDEGAHIGARYVPYELARYFKRDSMVLLESSMTRRVERTHQEYVEHAQDEYVQLYGAERGLVAWFDSMCEKLKRIRKRLGQERLSFVLGLLEKGYAEQMQGVRTDCHRQWVEFLLHEYYDPMYDYQSKKGGRTILFQGGFDEVKEYLLSLV
ncbi:MAG: tRNA 2-selenouridine(34) synthase MnmH [Deltaproteobacteria bacterium]|nr:MAG: tRNA 2-selenouridine(34) synthase MnmH [Deltaproteobacteria bacterium]